MYIWYEVNVVLITLLCDCCVLGVLLNQQICYTTKCFAEHLYSYFVQESSSWWKDNSDTILVELWKHIGVVNWGISWHECSPINCFIGLQGRPELTPVAIKAGKMLARRMFTNSSIQMDYDLVRFYCSFCLFFFLLRSDFVFLLLLF